MKFILTGSIVFCYCIVFSQSRVKNDTVTLEKIETLSTNDSLVDINDRKAFFGLIEQQVELDKDSSVFGLEEEKDPTIDLLIQDYIENKRFIGYRIQIYASNERWEAVKVRSEFLKKYPDEKSYLVYQAPNFKVRIGDYQNRFTTQEHLETIKIDFPSAFVVKDEIEPIAE